MSSQATSRATRISASESQVRRKDGIVIWISENAVGVRDDSGRLLYYEGFVRSLEGAGLVESSRGEYPTVSNTRRRKKRPLKPDAPKASSENQRLPAWR